MGATSWRYYTPYRPDPEEALQALRADVYARGDYVDPTGPSDDVLRRTARRFGQDPDSPEVRQIIDDTLRIQQAIETGDTRGMRRADRALVQRVRQFTQLATQLGAAIPRPGQRPRNIEELVDVAAESGTHSVLDIEHVGRRLGFGIAAPMSLAMLQRTFGTREPTHEQVEEYWSDIAERLRPWQARYFAVYRDGEPHEYAFVGCSGD
jgi:hypothetical protein